MAGYNVLARKVSAKTLDTLEDAADDVSRQEYQRRACRARGISFSVLLY